MRLIDEFVNYLDLAALGFTHAKEEFGHIYTQKASIFLFFCI